jgi:hypothetical protein
MSTGLAGAAAGWKSWYDPGMQALTRRRFRPGRRRAIDRGLRRIAVKNRYLMLL